MTQYKPIIMINNVRLVNPALFRAVQSTKFPNSQPTFNGVILLDKTEHAEDITNIKKLLAKLVADELKMKPANFNRKDLPMDDGDVMSDSGSTEEKYDDSYQKGNYVMFTKTQFAPALINENLERLTPEFAEANEMFKSGCYVNVKVQLRPNTLHGNKRINAGILGIQFVRPGEPIGNAVDPLSGFSNIATANNHDDDDNGIGEIPF